MTRRVYLLPLQLAKSLKSVSADKIVVSENENFKVGHHVQSTAGWNRRSMPTAESVLANNLSSTIQLGATSMGTTVESQLHFTPKIPRLPNHNLPFPNADSKNFVPSGTIDFQYNHIRQLERRENLTYFFVTPSFNNGIISYCSWINKLIVDPKCNYHWVFAL